jgi:DICT domain-containing protein
MTLTELIAGVEAHEGILTVFDADPAVVASLRERFADRNVAVEEGTAADGPDEFAVLHRDGEFVTAIDVADLPDADAERRVDFADSPYRAVVDQLDETMFTSYDSSEMVAASREIEDRAWRVGDGSLHAGFQTVSTLLGQSDVYGRLAERGDLDVVAYAYPDEQPDAAPCPVRLCRSDEIRRTWFVAFDGGGVDANKCALVAEEREPRRFYGFWTYGADTVDYVIDHLTHSYALAEDGEADHGADA